MHSVDFFFILSSLCFAFFSFFSFSFRSFSACRCSSSLRRSSTLCLSLSSKDTTGYSKEVGRTLKILSKTIYLLTRDNPSEGTLPQRDGYSKRTLPQRDGYSKRTLPQRDGYSKRTLPQRDGYSKRTLPRETDN